jgi:hypothetical protein
MHEEMSYILAIKEMLTSHPDNGNHQENEQQQMLGK